MQLICKTRPLLGLAALAVLGLTGAHCAEAQSYTYATLDDPAATSFNFAQGINDSGQIVGYYTDSDTETAHGYFYSASGGFSAVRDPLADPMAAEGTTASGINNAGQIVGSYNNATGSHGFVDTPGTGYASLDDPLAAGGNTFARSINSTGQVVGFYTDANYGTDPSSFSHGFLETPTGFVELDDPNATEGTGAFGINSSGTVVGEYKDSTGVHGFVYTGAGYAIIDDPLAKGETIAYGINDAGDIVGRYFDGTNLDGFVDDHGTFTTLSAPDASDGTGAFGINNAGTIVGYYAVNAPGTYNYAHGFEATPAAVPEASTTVSFGLLLALGLGGAVVAARRKAAAA